MFDAPQPRFNRTKVPGSCSHLLDSQLIASKFLYDVHNPKTRYDKERGPTAKKGSAGALYTWPRDVRSKLNTLDPTVPFEVGSIHENPPS